jgi:glycosyltransferase involved in cell wall biosynthesis
MNAVIVSYGLDTNGQNHRYKVAADKFGSDPAVLSVFAIGPSDPAGVVGRFKAAADKHGGLHIRSASRDKYIYLQYPVDIYWERRKNDAEILELMQQADVIHLNNSPKALEVFRVKKPTLIHHHGSLFRTNPSFMLNLAQTRRWASAVSTIDLLQSAPDVLHWLPTAYDIDALQALGKANRREPDGRVRLLSAPTNREFKSTDLLERVVRELQAEGVPVDLELVVQRPNAECLVRKAGADILFDQIMFGYGCNAVEAWGLGVPVIAGGDDWTLAEMRRQWGGLPFYEANERTLKERIREMVESKALREEWAGIGMAHVRKYHDELPALTKLAELYALALEYGKSGRAIPGKPAVGVRFKSKHSHIGTVQFIKGQAEVSDPYEIAHLRTLAKRKNYGIEEVA